MPVGVYKHHPHQGFQKNNTFWKKVKHYSGEKHYWYGKHHSEETKIKMSNAQTGEKNPQWKGGRRYNIRGYILIKKPNHPFCDKNGYIREHRLVIEKQIGRHLKLSEKSHHLGERDDNRPHMLMAFISNSAHRRFEQGGIVKPSEIIFDGRKLIHSVA